MKKAFVLVLGLIIMTGIVTAQQSINEKRLAKAKEKGNVLFESTLKDADMVIVSTKSVSTTIEMKYWTLKFANGAVFSIWEGPNANEILGHVWWIGKRYVVYCTKALKAVVHVYVELVEEKEEKT